MNGMTLILAMLLSSTVASPAHDDTRPMRITNERGTAVIFTPPSTESVAAIDGYIASRHRLLDRLALQSPGEHLAAQISFSKHLAAEELLAEMNGAGVTIRSLDFGWDGQSGGFALRKGERLEDELARLTQYHGDFIAQMEESRQLIEDETRRENHRPEDQVRYQRHIEHVDNLGSAYRARGVLFIGAKVEGSARSLLTLRNHAKYIRLVDPLWDELSDASGVSDVRKIAVPLGPDVE